MLLWQLARLAFSRALANTGNRIAARIAIMAITTKSSIRVKAVVLLLRIFSPSKLIFLCRHHNYAPFIQESNALFGRCELILTVFYLSFRCMNAEQKVIERTFAQHPIVTPVKHA
jgi:hypothetical protein